MEPGPSLTPHSSTWDNYSIYWAAAEQIARKKKKELSSSVPPVSNRRIGPVSNTLVNQDMTHSKISIDSMNQSVFPLYVNMLDYEARKPDQRSTPNNLKNQDYRYVEIG